MRLARLYITLALVVFASCEEPAATEETTSAVPQQESELEDVTETEEIAEAEDDDTLKIVTGNPLDDDNEQLPILPPIILLDFANDLDNSSSSNDDKSKRTIDSNLGYGFGRNNLFTGKYNYYFPAGKSGTSVSIEESISPFLPKTIIETVKPITEKSQMGESNIIYGQNPLQQNNYPSMPGPSANGQTVRPPINRYLDRQPVFGQRTKLYKPSQIDYTSYQSFGSTPKSTVETYTTPRQDYRLHPQLNSQNVYTTPKPSFQSNNYSPGYSQASETSQTPFASYSTPAPPAYVTPTAPSYQTRYTSNYNTLRPTYDAPTTSRPSAGQVYSTGSPLDSFAHLPRYTIENGIRYENKIVWKYPDGKVSQTPPPSYVNAYNEFLMKQRPGVGPPTSYQNVATGNYQIPGGIPSYQNGGSGQTSLQNPNYQQQLVRYHVPQQDNRYSVEGFGNIHSKSPAQFPNDPEANRPLRPSQFVSSASFIGGYSGAGSRGQQVPQGQSFEQPYQGQYGQKTPLRGSPSMTSSGHLRLVNENSKIPKDSYGAPTYEEQRPLSKYAVNSPNPEYTYSTDSPLKSTTATSSTRLFTPSGNLSPNILSKYTSQAQKYLTKVFASDTSGPGDQSYSTPMTPYANTNYENLLNYNPSISQYIRNPSSILNAQPTYIQAGNSLIPVIILRVDGAPPIQPKVTPNINLKALLQQYLTQYAGTIGQNANRNIGNYGKTSNVPSTEYTPQNPLYELTQLAQSLTQYSQNPSIANQFAKQFEGSLNQNSYEASSSFGPKPSYESGKSDSRNNYGTKTTKQKVKSVQIIEDPRFTSYKVNN